MYIRFSSVFMLVSMVLILANSGGVPQAVSKAPGESNHNSCATCHTPSGSFNTSISMHVLNAQMDTVSSYVPNETYTVNVQVSATNNPKAFGFQMVALDSLTNTDMGNWGTLGERVKKQNLTVGGKQRIYLVQSSPKTNGAFTVQWKAPASDKGKIKFYMAGLAINQNGNTSGDNNTVGAFTLNSPMSSSTFEENPQSIICYPNPANDFIHFTNPGVTTAEIISISGIPVKTITVTGLCADISSLSPGYYLIRLRNKNQQVLGTTSFIKSM
jgi:hypothetical protein